MELPSRLVTPSTAGFQRLGLRTREGRHGRCARAGSQPPLRTGALEKACARAHPHPPTHSPTHTCVSRAACSLAQPAPSNASKTQTRWAAPLASDPQEVVRGHRHALTDTRLIQLLQPNTHQGQQSPPTCIIILMDARGWVMSPTEPYDQAKMTSTASCHAKRGNCRGVCVWGGAWVSSGFGFPLGQHGLRLMSSAGRHAKRGNCRVARQGGRDAMRVWWPGPCSQAGRAPPPLSHNGLYVRALCPRKGAACAGTGTSRHTARPPRP